MASRNHQVGIEINANVKGQESISDLTTRLDDAAKVLGGELKVKAQQAAAELRELGVQDAAIKAFRSLKQEAADSARALKTIEGEVASYNKQITAAGPPTAKEAAELQKLQAAASAASVKLAQQNQALGQATSDLQRFGVASNSTQAAQQRLTEKTQALRDSVKDLVPAYQNAGAGAAKAAAEQNRSHRDIKDGVSSISEQLALVQKAYLGLQAAQGAINMVKGIAETADAYNNLGARIKLATGDGAAFSSAMAGISAVAQRTSTGLEATGTLFTKLAQAGKEMGVGQAEALKLTETVNQAIQLSGASAAASDAAVTQLIQGLQSGVLRGDEFNSVMEQAPRLAKVLADGLGVTTGELRKMAEAGQLSSETVIKALQGQSDVVASEFGKLPDTVGRALTQLNNAWTQYVGETDKATGASTLAAQAIGQLAKNLPAIAGFLLDAGQAAGAFAALKLGQHFLSIASGATAATGAMVGATGAMGASTVAAGIAARAVAMLSVALRAIPLFGLMALVANLKDVGVWLGETAAKAMGYRDRSKEMDAADQAAAAATAKHTEELKRKNAALVEANNRLTGYSDLVQKQVDRLTLSAQALAGEAQARKALAGALGDETDVRNANAAAAEMENQANQKTLQAAQLELNFLRDTIIEKTALLASQGKISEASQKELGELSAMLGKRQEAVDKMQAQAKGSELLAAKTALEVETHKDNSARLGELRAAYEAVTREVDALRKKKEAGAPVDDALYSKQIAQAKALALYRDAVTDLTGKIELETKVKAASLQLSIAQATASQNHYTAMAAEARASGDLEKAMWLEVKAKEESIRVLKLKLQLDELQQQADLLVIEAKRKLINAETEEGQQKLKLLDIETQMIKIKAAGNQAILDQINALEREADAIRNGTNDLDKNSGSRHANAGSIDAQTSALERQNSEQERANAAKEKAIELENKRLNVDKEGFSLDKSGGRLTQQVETRASVAASLTSRGVSDAQAKTIAAQLVSELGQVNLKSSGVYQNGDTLDAVLQKLAERNQSSTASTARQDQTIKYEDGSVGPDPGGVMARNARLYGHPWVSSKAEYDKLAAAANQIAAQKQAGTTSPAAQAAPDSTKTVNINLSINNNNIGTVDTSPAGSAVMQSFIDALQRSKLASGS